MSSQPEQKAFLPANGPQEVATDMTGESVARQLSAPVQNYFYFVVISLTVGLLAALGTILVLVLQRTGSVPLCDEHRDVGRPEASLSPHTMSCDNAAAYLQVSIRVNQSQLMWLEDGLLHNIKYDKGNLVIQTSGLYFVYCHLHFNVEKCNGSSIIQNLELLVNGNSTKQTIHTLCYAGMPTVRKHHSLVQVLLVELKEGDQVSVEINPFRYLDIHTLAKNNVLGAFKYSGKDWANPLLKTFIGTCP